VERGRLLDSKFAADAINSDSLMDKNFSALLEKQKTQSILITVTTARIINLKGLDVPITGIQGIPVGIIRDFHNESLHSNLRPTFLRATANPEYGKLLIRLKNINDINTKAKIYRLLKQFYPQKLFEFSVVNDLIDAQYKTENKLQILLTVFSILTIFLACLGLSGLSIFISQQRFREIGIRRAIGASTRSIIVLLSKDFLGLVLIAIIIACPLAWIILNNWLQNYPYRISLQTWIFLLSGVVSMLFAIIAVVSQAIRGALANPIKALRTE
jgi:putative ABC transport system permease protein